MTASEALLVISLVAAAIAIVIVVFKLFKLRSEFQSRVQEQYEAFRKNELQALSQQYEELAQNKALLRFEQWTKAKEEEIRKDAINRSRVVTIGKVSEQVIPFHPDFSYNPKDARFIGSPVDFIVFDGLDDKEVRKVVFIEVKTGGATLTRRERQIKDAVDRRLVEFKVLSILPVPAVTQRSLRGAHLIAVEPADPIPTDFSLMKDEISVGRSEDNDVVIPHPSISRVHARLMHRDGDYELTDLGSANGSFVSNQQVSAPTIVANGSELRFGSIRFILRF